MSVTYLIEKKILLPFQGAHWFADCPIKKTVRIWGNGYPKNGEQHFLGFWQEEPDEPKQREIWLMFWDRYPNEIFLKINDGDDDYHAKQYTPDQIEQAKQDLEYLLLASNYMEMVEAAHGIGFDRD